MINNENDLRVFWIPQVPMQAFYVPVKTLQEAKLVLDTLARYDTFQFETHVKGDYSNVGGLQIYQDGEWVDWENEDGESIDDIEMETKL